MPAPLVAAAGSVVVSMLGPFIERLIGLIPNPEAKAQAAQEWAVLSVQVAERSDENQTRLLELDAQQNGFFKGGWRPAVGWMCAIGLGMQTIVYPLLGWALSVWSPGTPLPQLDTELLVGLLVPMLGLGGYRTIERINRR